MITLTQTAISKVTEFAANMPDAAGKDLRIFIQGVSCSGLQYGFTFDDTRDGDTIVEAGDLRVLIDPQSAPYLTGATVHFIDDKRGAGFTVDNPNAAMFASSCDGCGGSCG